MEAADGTSLVAVVGVAAVDDGVVDDADFHVKGGEIRRGRSWDLPENMPDSLGDTQLHDDDGPFVGGRNCCNPWQPSCCGIADCNYLDSVGWDTGVGDC